MLAAVFAFVASFVLLSDISLAATTAPAKTTAVRAPLGRVARKKAVAKVPTKKVVKPVIKYPTFKPYVPPAEPPVRSVVNKPLPSRYTDTVIVTKPIVLGADEVMEIKDTHYILYADIILKENSRLVISNSLFEQRKASGATSIPGLRAEKYAEVAVIGSELNFDKGVTWNFKGYSNLKLSDVQIPVNDTTNFMVWFAIGENTKVTSKNTKFFGSLADQAHVDIAEASEMMLDLKLSGGAIVDEAFPTEIKDYSFPGSNDRNLYMKLHISNSKAIKWAVTAYPTSNLTIRDTNPINVSFIIGWPAENSVASFDNLRPGHYDNRLINFRTTNIRLINTTVGSWYPLAGEGNTLMIKGSDLSEVAWSWGGAKIMLENCTAISLEATHDVEITAKNCVISGDVLAADHGKINLINSSVGGKRIVHDQGVINDNGGVVSSVMTLSK